MKIDIGRYTLDMDYDPREQNNASDKKVPIEDIGFIYNCVFKQKAAFVHSVEKIREVYPDSKIYAVSDGGLDYSFLQDENLETTLEEDTVSPLKGIGHLNFTTPENQKIIKTGMAATLDRVQRGIEYCGNPKWTCLTEPDVLIRGKISHPEGAKLLGTRVNCAWYTDTCLDMFMGMNEIISQIEGSSPVLRWGSVPVIFHTETFLKALKVYEDNFELLDKITEKHYAPGTFDLFMGIIFSLIGESETFSDEYTECLRNPSWKTSGQPIVHQYREFYEQSDHYGG